MRRSMAPASLNGTAIVRSEAAFGNSGAVRQRRVVVGVADVLVGDGDRDHHVVVVAVVGAEDLDDRVAAGEGAGDADSVHRRLGTGVDVAPLREAEAAGQLLADDDGVLDRRRKVSATSDLSLHGLDDGRVGVPLHHRPEPIVEIDHLGAVDVPDL